MPDAALIQDLPLELTAEPLDYIYADHMRQRMVCNLLEQQVLSAAPDRVIAAAILGFIHRELPLHVEDEEHDLFPLLKKRAQESDELLRLLTQLSAEHAQDESRLKDVERALGMMAAGLSISPRAQCCKNALIFAKNQRRHLALENGALLPLARIRLRRHDLEMLGESMRKRR